MSPSGPILVPNSVNKSKVIPIGNKVLLQPYFWLMPDTGTLWTQLTDYIPYFKQIGFDSLWLPPVAKTQSGDIARGGYEPYDYYDLGQYNQKGAVQTRYGSRAELEQLIQAANDAGIGTIADVVINHRVGGFPENNTFTGTVTNTNFMEVLSGKLKMNYTDFWPNKYGTGDRFQYGSLPDISHSVPYVQSEFVKYGLWLRDVIGFDGYRFDTALGIPPFMLRYWMQNVTGTWGAAEYWARYPERNDIMSYIKQTNNTVTAFDFPLLAHLRDMTNFNGSYDMRMLPFSGLSWINPKAVTFAVNHDTYRDSFNIKANRQLAYAYIMTHQGYPSVFWMDYLNPNLHGFLNTIVQIHNLYAKGDTKLLYVDQDNYVAQRMGDPGLIIAINDNPITSKSIQIHTKWNSSTLHELTGRFGSIKTDSFGNTTLQIPPSNFLIYSTGQPVSNLSRIVDINSFRSPTALEKRTVDLTSPFDDKWGNPVYMDKIGDAFEAPFDLSNLYARYDNNNLYVSLNYDNLYDGHQGKIDYGLALSNKFGGAIDDPGLHPDIKWAGTDNRPDFLIYVHTDQKSDSYKRYITGISSYEWTGNAWKNSSLTLTTKMDKIIGNVEFKIPLQQLQIEGQVSLKGFATPSNFTGVKDSVPQDQTIAIHGGETSWLFMPPSLTLDYYSSNSSVTSKTSRSSTSTSGNPISVSYVVFLSPAIMIIVKKRLFR